MEVEEYFGRNAGKVWHVLKEKSEMGVKELSRAVKLKTTDTFGAIGWLAREGKIIIGFDKRGRMRFSLKE